MQPNFQRFLPIILIVFVLLFIVPALFRHSSSSKNPSSKTLAADSTGAITLVDKSERAYRSSHGRYTDRVSDLLALTPALGPSLADGVVIELDVSSDGKTYLAHVTSNVLGLTRGRIGDKRVANGCIVIKSASGVDCPEGTRSTTTTGTTTTTSTSSTTTTS